MIKLKSAPACSIAPGKRNLGFAVLCLALTAQGAHGGDISACSSGDPDERISDCTGIIERGNVGHDQLAAAYDGRCWAYNLKGAHERALRDCDKSIHLRPTYAYAHNNRGVALENLGRIREALRSYQTALSLKPNFRIARENVLRLQSSSGDSRQQEPSPPSGQSRSSACEKYPDLCQ